MTRSPAAATALPPAALAWLCDAAAALRMAALSPAPPPLRRALSGEVLFGPRPLAAIAPTPHPRWRALAGGVIHLPAGHRPRRRLRWRALVGTKGQIQIPAGASPHPRWRALAGGVIHLLAGHRPRRRLRWRAFAGGVVFGVQALASLAPAAPPLWRDVERAILPAARAFFRRWRRRSSGGGSAVFPRAGAVPAGLPHADTAFDGAVLPRAGAVPALARAGAVPAPAARPGWRAVFGAGLLIAAALFASAPAARADAVVDRTLERVVLPAFAGFSAAAAGLEAAARADCRAADPALRTAFQAAYDAWIPVQRYHAGPMEEGGRNLAIAFWPDPKGATPRALRQLLAAGGPALASPAAFARVSVAARGFSGLQAMLYDPAFNGYGPADPGCRLTRAAAGDLAALAAGLDRDWRGFAADLRSPGPGNPRVLSEREARQILFTAFLGGLQFDEENRLARPLGTPDRPRPERAEARASGRSLRNVQISLAAAQDLGGSLTLGATGETFPALAYAIRVAARLDDPVFDGVATASGRLKVQDLKDAIHRTREYARLELGAELGVSAGFNALDGD